MQFFGWPLILDVLFFPWSRPEDSGRVPILFVHLYDLRPGRSFSSFGMDSNRYFLLLGALLGCSQ